MEYSEYPLHAWSRSRHRMRKVCPRKAMLCYRDARAGAEPLAEAHLRQLHEYRNRISLDAYLQRMLHHFLRREFYSTSIDDGALFADTAALARAMQNRFSRELERMIYGDSTRDHRLFFLRELEERSCRLPELMREGERKIDGLCRALDRELWKLISNTPLVSRRNIASPLAVQINELCCYCAPLLALEVHGAYWIIEFYGDERSALLHKFYGINQLGREPDQLRSFSYNAVSGEFSEIGRELNVTQELDAISADGAAWEELLASPTGTLTGNPEHCNICEYNKFCQKYYPTTQTDRGAL